ncbi:MAG: Re/Si-specific NAD(P)(+) transhydrogenase subunit alpha [Capsulimonadaceae bacterium]|nr:Re/Si-specific NAD(P)(+) transhydrogenase subunit alpha [Capsulimonadaceae bacterium]
MIVAVPRETKQGERRVALVPDGISRLTKSGLTVRVESGAGESAGFIDEAYKTAGAEIASDAASLYKGADFVLKIQRPDDAELKLIPKSAILIALLSPLGDPQYVKKIADHGLTAISLELIPRTTRAQSMDVLSSQANIAGYKAVILAAANAPTFFPMMTTAAGTVPPAKAIVLGAGVAGLQAIATARRLGAVVSAFDVRAVVKEQVQSLGAEFVEIDLGIDASGAGGYARALTEEESKKQRALLGDVIAQKDIVITTAQVPGRPAPVMIEEETVKRMKPGSVIVDLAAGEAGGNCTLTKKNEIITAHGVTIIGLTDLAATVPNDASKLFTRNMTTLMALIVTKEGALNLDFSDDIVAAATITANGEIRHAGTRQALGLPLEGEAK